MPQLAQDGLGHRTFVGAAPDTNRPQRHLEVGERNSYQTAEAFRKQRRGDRPSLSRTDVRKERLDAGKLTRRQ